MATPVFISHSSRDLKPVRALVEALEARGIGCWLSERDIAAGDNYGDSIVDAIEKASAMVLVFSVNADNSDEIKKEIALASQRRITVVPVRIAEVTPSKMFRYELATRNWIDLFPNREEGLAKLADRLASILALAPIAPMPAPTQRPRPKLAYGLAAAATLAVVAALAWYATRPLTPMPTPPVAAAPTPLPAASPTLAVATPAPSPASPVTAAPTPLPSTSPTLAAATPAPSPTPPVVTSPTPLHASPTLSVSTPAPSAAATPAPSLEPATAKPSPIPLAPAPLAPPTPASPTVVALDPPAPSAPQATEPASVPAAFIPAAPQTPATLPAKPAAVPIGPAPSVAAGDPGGEIFRECDDCPTMVVIPAGKAMLGSPPGEPGRKTGEVAPHEVDIARPFAVARHATTFDEWDACIADGGCNARRPGDYGFGRKNRPVILVSWNDAEAYVDWVKRKTGAPYRLLSEAEWEYAARGCTSPKCPYAAFWFGSIRPELAVYDSRFAYDGSPKANAALKTAPADSGAPNPFGLYNMLGNVRQWAADCWNATPPATRSDGAPLLSGDCDERATRGGSWSDQPGDLRAAARSWESADERSPYIGFRVARTLTP